MRALLRTLSGTGTLGTVITSATSASAGVAHIAPGVNVSGANNNFGAAGTLRLSGGLTIGNGTNLDFDLGTSSDLISAGGTFVPRKQRCLEYRPREPVFPRERVTP